MSVKVRDGRNIGRSAIPDEEVGRGMGQTSAGGHLIQYYVLSFARREKNGQTTLCEIVCPMASSSLGPGRCLTNGRRRTEIPVVCPIHTVGGTTGKHGRDCIERKYTHSRDEERRRVCHAHLVEATPCAHIEETHTHPCRDAGKRRER